MIDWASFSARAKRSSEEIDTSGGDGGVVVADASILGVAPGSGAEVRGGRAVWVSMGRDGFRGCVGVGGAAIDAVEGERCRTGSAEAGFAGDSTEILEFLDW